MVYIWTRMCVPKTSSSNSVNAGSWANGSDVMVPSTQGTHVINLKAYLKFHAECATNAVDGFFVKLFWLAGNADRITAAVAATWSADWWATYGDLVRASYEEILPVRNYTGAAHGSTVSSSISFPCPTNIFMGPNDSCALLVMKYNFGSGGNSLYVNSVWTFDFADE